MLLQGNDSMTEEMKDVFMLQVGNISFNATKATIMEVLSQLCGLLVERP